ncbi:MAG: hypothetical protein K0S45_2829, partial [Nitrospira sp.]|nr:hypothetical protein [Nitrospira sp.]
MEAGCKGISRAALFLKGRTMKPFLVMSALLLGLLLSPLSASAQFMQGFGEGFQRTSQYGLARQQQATERERLKLQYADQWRQLRDQELRGEL